MASTRTYLRLFSWGSPSALETIQRTNSALFKEIKRGMFVTVMYAVLNVRARTFTVVSAGHNPMVVFREATGEIELVKPNGIALGFDGGPIFNRTLQEGTVQLGVGDRVVIYTDGVIEAMSPEHEEFGDERFYQWTRANARLKSPEFVTGLVEELKKHQGRAEQHDDITIVTMRIV
jgi:phosphoserine phosphatase RsbU/P